MKGPICITILLLSGLILRVEAQNDQLSPELQRHMIESLKRARELRKATDPVEGLKKLMEAIHPSLLAAKLLQEQIVRNGPIIQDYLRRTRYAISDEYHSDPLATTEDPFSFITLTSDRKIVKRNLQHIEDYITEISNSYNDDEKRQYVSGIQEALDRIERIYRNYGIEFDGNDLVGGASESAGVVNLIPGDWSGWGAMTISKAGGKYKGTYTDTYVDTKLGTIELYFDGTSWKGTWGEQAIGRKGNLYEISVDETGTQISGKYDVTADGGKGFRKDVQFKFTLSKRK